jgi:signal transduction histidine kinase
VILFFVLVGVGMQDFFHRRKIRDQLTLETMKREEKIKIRQQTAEDFHDDLGNKLTRINVLAEILNTKIDADKTDQRNLVDQIRQNVASLYNGTKDILWALDPKSDNLYEMLTHIKEVGSEIFQDTPITFQFIEADESLKNVKLTMEYSRNITMIFKETLNNVLKHANATKVIIDAKAITENEILISLRDNGNGFDQDKIKKGYGINNIKARAKRINRELNIFSKNSMGTIVELKFRKI